MNNLSTVWLVWEYYFDIPISIYGVLVFFPPWLRVNTSLLCSVNPHT